MTEEKSSGFGEHNTKQGPEFMTIILGRGVTALGVARNMGRLGIRSIALCDREDFSMHSRFITERRIIPHLRNDPSALITEFQKIVQQYPQTRFCLFPCSDEHLLVVGKMRHEIPDSIFLNQSNLEKLNLILDKARFYQLLEKHGLSYPRSFFPKHPSDIILLQDQLEFPVFIKPMHSHIFRTVFNGQKGFRASNMQEATAYMQQCFALTIEVMITEIVPGPSDNHFFLDGYVSRDGDLQALFTRRRLHMHPPDFGNSTSLVSVSPESIAPAVTELKALLKVLDYRGIFSLEVKLDERNGQYKMLDMNGRSWWYAAFPTMCGININLYAFNDTLNLPLPPANSVKLDCAFVYLWPELKALGCMVRAGKISTLQALGRFRWTLNYPIFALDDPLPLAYRAGNWLKEKLARPVHVHG